MVTEREPIIEVYDLQISIKPTDKKGFYLTGEKPEFKAIIRNLSDKKRSGALLFNWRLGDFAMYRAVPIDIDSRATMEHTFPREWLAMEGNAYYQLVNMPKPPEAYTESNLVDSGSYHPLCSYVVKDKDIVADERRNRWITYIILGIAAAASVILLIKTLLG